MLRVCCTTTGGVHLPSSRAYHGSLRSVPGNLRYHGFDYGIPRVQIQEAVGRGTGPLKVKGTGDCALAFCPKKRYNFST